MKQTATFAGGCFWCTEAVFRELKGVKNITVGYTGGTASVGGEKPTYEVVRSGTTGHAEAIHVEYDSSVISYRDLLTVFFATHDPTVRNRQGDDVGTQYRSVIFYANDTQKEDVREFVAELERDGVFGKSIVTELEPLEKFYPAEEYHQQYFKKNPGNAYCKVTIGPKIEKLHKKFAKLLKSR